MELTMTNNFGFCELNENEMMIVDGGGVWQTAWNVTKEVFKGVAIISGVVLAGATAMTAAPYVLAAGTATFAIYGVAAIASCSYAAFEAGYATGTNIRNCF